MSLTKTKIHEHYSESVKYFKTNSDEEPSTQLSEVDLNWFANAYHNVRDKLDCIIELENSDQYDGGDYKKNDISSMIDDKRDELIAICVDVIHFIENTLFQNLKISTREKAFALKLKGDFLRYVWEISPNEVTYKQASEAYHDAISMCQWNYESTDLFSLQVAMNYTIHLMNANFTDKAIIILQTTINNALKDLDNHDPTNKSLVESLLENLKENLMYFQEIADAKRSISVFEVDEYLTETDDFEEQTETEPDNTVIRKLD